MTDRDRYRNHTYSESRDRGRAEHGRYDLDEFAAWGDQAAEVADYMATTSQAQFGD